MNLTNCPVCSREIDEDKELGMMYIGGLYGERLVCGKCVPIHFCRWCDDFDWDEIDLTPCGKRLCSDCVEELEYENAEQQKFADEIAELEQKLAGKKTEQQKLADNIAELERKLADKKNKQQKFAEEIAEPSWIRK
jgi:uncharacterized coiled-coil protein SlyX